MLNVATFWGILFWGISEQGEWIRHVYIYIYNKELADLGWLEKHFSKHSPRKIYCSWCDKRIVLSPKYLFYSFFYEINWSVIDRHKRSHKPLLVLLYLLSFLLWNKLSYLQTFSYKTSSKQILFIKNIFSCTWSYYKYVVLEIQQTYLL